MRKRTLSELDRSLLQGHEFDIFLSFAPADVEFAEEMRLRLMTRFDHVIHVIIIIIVIIIIYIEQVSVSILHQKE